MKWIVGAIIAYAGFLMLAAAYNNSLNQTFSAVKKAFTT